MNPIPIPSLLNDPDDDLSGSLDRQIRAVSPPLDRLEPVSPIPLVTTSAETEMVTASASTSESMTVPHTTNISISATANASSNSTSSSINDIGSIGKARSSLFLLLTCPDMEAFLRGSELSEDVYLLPLPLSTLLSEAKEEVIAKHQRHIQTMPLPMHGYSALEQLHVLKDYVWEASGHDISSMMPVLECLIHNEDQLENVIRCRRSYE